MKPPQLGSTFDHLLLAQRHPIETVRFVAFLGRAGRDRGAVLMPRVEHEHDDRCCRLEAWSATLLRLLALASEGRR